MFKSNCHTHTTYCDGKNSAREMIEAAISKGFVSLGFSGHSPMKENNDWTMTVQGLESYKSELAALKDEYKNQIDILCGIELDADYSGVNIDEYDYVIGSVHQFRKGNKFYDVDYSAEMLQEAIDEFFDGSFVEMSREYFSALADFVISTKVNVVGHIDLITKFNIDKPLFDESNEDYRKAAFDAVDRILAYKPDILFEVNTGAMYRKGKKEPYPAPFILQYICERGGKITLTSDSHCCESIDFAFDSSVALCKECGFDKIYYLTSDGVKFIEI